MTTQQIAYRFILETFARTGRSPALEEIRSELGLASAADAEAAVGDLERAGVIHRNPGDRLITHAYPFSNEPTPHRVRLADGPEVYAMCAIDALGMPFMLRKDADIVSECAQCGTDIVVKITCERVIEKKPEAIVVWNADRKDGCVAATDLCPDLKFFCSPRHLDAWARGREGHALTFDEAVQRGRQVFEALLHRQNDCCS